MSIYDYKLNKPDGTEVSLEEYKSKVLLIVNTATGCGFTPQYDPIEKMYENYHDRGFRAISLPDRHRERMRRYTISVLSASIRNSRSLKNPMSTARTSSLFTHILRSSRAFQASARDRRRLLWVYCSKGSTKTIRTIPRSNGISQNS